MKKSTQELLSLIQNTEDIELYLKENETELLHLSLGDYLQRLLKNKHMKISDVMNRSQQSDYVYIVFKNQRNVSRDILIAIALGMDCELDEAQTMLRIASKARLDPRNPRDAIFIYALLHHLSVLQVNEILYNLGTRVL